MRPFVHLHVHTEYSLLDGAARISRLNDRCREMDMPAVAITDHGNMYGVIEFYDTLSERKIEAEKRKGNTLKPIIGCEFYYTDDISIKSGGMHDLNHLVLLAKDYTGYKNLLKLSSISFTEGFYYKPRIDLNLLRKYSEGLICLSACIKGYVASCLLENDYEGARAHAETLLNIFGREDFYIELQDHGIIEQKRVNPLLYKLSKELNVGVVATNDVHYIDREDSEMQDVLICVQTGKTIDNEARLKFFGSEFYLKSGDEMAELFSWCPEAIDNSVRIASRCNVELMFKQPLLPPYRPQDGSRPQDFLRELTYKGLSKRYAKLHKIIRDRADYELDIIIKMGFTEYYLIVWDFINYAHMNNIPVGAGRGSGVGSIVAYAIEITNVDPVRYNLLFERFLNPERISNPDFDIDFCYEGRGQVIDYVINKYGSDKVAQIITFGTMAAKAAIKDVARVYNMPLSNVDRITKQIPAINASIPAILGLDDKKIKEKIPEIVELYRNDPEVFKVLNMAMKLEGMPRNSSTHAAGVVISRDPVSEHVPLQRNGEDITTQYNKDEIEDIGLLKMDFLGLRTLTDVKYAKLYIKETTGKEIDFTELGYDDPDVYRMIGTGKTDAVFQLESGGMKSFMKQLKPENMEDIIAGISLYRPGPMESIPKFVENKNKHKRIIYDHPMLKPILEVTYGCIVYQEQVMQIVRDLAGYSYGRADILRRAMSKKKKGAMAKEKKTFIYGVKESKNSPEVEGALARGVPEDVASKIYDQMEAFASYAFNKSHAAAYAVLSYETAYLKYYYPAQFITAVINNRIGDAKEIAKYILHARDLSIEILPPDINKSRVKFSCEGGKIRYGLMALKNVGEQAVERIIAERESRGAYLNLNDFILRAEGAILNKRMLESLILSGAMDCFNETRATLMSSYEDIMSAVNEDKKMRDFGQFSFFEMEGGIKGSSKLSYVAEYRIKDKLIKEKEILGTYISGHPLEEYRKLYDNLFTTAMIINSQSNDEGDSDWLREFDNKEVLMGGILLDVKKHMDKNGRDMAICTLEDLYGVIEVVFFNSYYSRCKNTLIPDTIIMVSGKLSTRRGNVSLMGDTVTRWENKTTCPIKKTDGRYLCVRLKNKEMINELTDILTTYKGETEVRIQIDNKLYDPKVKVSIVNALMYELYSFIGQENVLIDNRQ